MIYKFSLWSLHMIISITKWQMSYKHTYLSLGNRSMIYVCLYDICHLVIDQWYMYVCMTFVTW
jgi:hypothetical protein